MDASGARDRTREAPRAPRRPRSVLISLLLAALLAAPLALAGPAAAAGPGPVAYPDLVSFIPPNDLQITHPTPTTKEFDYEHVIYNAGLGPLEIQPSNYDPSTGLASGTQNVYAYDTNGTATLAQQVVTHDQFFFHTLHGHFHFPMASFGLYGVNADGSVGSPVALSPKNGFCIADSTHVDPTLPHSPAGVGNSGGTCTDPNAVRGISSGWGDLYNRGDPGQAIDITGIPDGTYWFHTVVDPGNNFAESDKTNNTTDVKVRIAGDTVTQVSPLQSQGAFVIDQSFIENGVTNIQSTPSFSTANAGDLLVAAVAADGPNSAQSASVSGAGLTWTLAKRSNTQHGTAEVWTAKATGVLSNAVVTSTLSATGGALNHTLTVLALAGAGGIGATASANAASGAPSVALTTTKPGSWVLGVGNDPDRWVPRAPAGGQTLVNQWFGEDIGKGSYWVQSPPAPTPLSGSVVTVGAAAPVGDAWNLAAVEIVPGVSTDTTPPVLSNGAATALGPDRATVSWTTNEPATSQVGYGTSPAVDQATTADPVLVTSHQQQLSGLTPATTYYCELRSTDSSGNAAVQPGLSFTTTPPRTTPPVFSAVRVTDLQPDQATFAWTTDEPADSQVEFGTTAAYGSASPRDPNLVTAHFVVVTGLAPSTGYHFRVNSTDGYANAGSSADGTFTTPAVPPPIVVDTTVSKDGNGTITSPPLTTAVPNELLVAFVASDGPGGNSQSATVSGAGLTWSLARRANTRSGTAEVWTALAPTALASATVTSTEARAGFDQSLTVVAFRGAVGIGATASSSLATGAASVTLNTTRTGSYVYAVGNDWDRAVARTVGAGQAMVHQWVDTGAGDTFWTQARSGATGAVESVITMNDTAPTNDQFNFLAVEVVRPVSIAPPPPPVVSGVSVSGVTTTGATVGWATDQPASSQVDYGITTAYGASTVLDATLTTAHSQVLGGLAPGTLYHYRVRSGNGAGTTVSADATFTTVAPDTTPPVVSAVAVSGISATGATVTWTTNEPATTQVDYGPTTGYGTSSPLNPALTAGHSVTLTGLSPSTGYHYRVRSTDAAGNPTVSGDLTFTTSTPPPPPVVSGVSVSGVTTTGATVGWATDQPASSQVDYGITTAYGASTVLDATLTTAHSQVLGGLAPGTLYHYRVRSGNGAGTTVSADATFTTVAPDTTPPVVSAVAVSGISATGATVTWTTNEPATTQVDYGPTTGYGTSSPLNPALTAGHSVTLTGLSPSTGYHYRVRSTDAAGNPTVSGDLTFTTSTPPAGIAIDKTVFRDARSTVTTASFTTAGPNELLLAFVAADGPTGTAQTATVSGAGLTWTLVRRVNTQAGTSEVWRALAPTTLSNVTVTSTPARSGFDQSLTVVAFKGASGVGASAGANKANGAPTVGLTTTAGGSWVFGVGNDWDSATARTLPTGQTMVHQWVDTSVGDTFWTQSTSAPTAVAGTAVTIADAAPTADRWNLVAIEVLAS